MANLGGEGSEARFEAYMEALIGVIGHADRAGPLRDYCVGLTAPLERKSVEPMAAATAPARTSAQHQSLLHFVGTAPWSDERVLAKVRELATPALERHGPVEAWIVDDTRYRGLAGHERSRSAMARQRAFRGPSLYLEFRFSRRAMLFDLGDLARLSSHHACSHTRAGRVFIPFARRGSKNTTARRDPLSEDFRLQVTRPRVSGFLSSVPNLKFEPSRRGVAVAKFPCEERGRSRWRVGVRRLIPTPVEPFGRERPVDNFAVNTLSY